MRRSSHLFMLAALLFTLAACGAPASPEPTPQPSPTTATPHLAERFCPEIPAPTLVVQAPEQMGTSVTLTTLAGDMFCEVALEGGTLRGRMVAANGSLFYPVTSEEGQSSVIWQMRADGTGGALEFTRVPATGQLSYDFAISADGTKIAWAYAVLGTPSGDAPAVNQNYLSVAALDGSGQTTLIDGERTQMTHLSPVRFSADNETLFYARQPDRAGGPWNAVLGRYHTLYRIPAVGGDPMLLLDCESLGSSLCIGDVAADGTIAYTDPGAQVIRVLDSDGGEIATLAAPEKDYIGMATFNQAGTLAFLAAEIGVDVGLPQPGTLYTVAAPYNTEPEQLLKENGVSGIWQWVGHEALLYARLGNEVPAPVGLVTLDGERYPLSGFPLTTLR